MSNALRICSSSSSVFSFHHSHRHRICNAFDSKRQAAGEVLANNKLLLQWQFSHSAQRSVTSIFYALLTFPFPFQLQFLPHHPFPLVALAALVSTQLRQAFKCKSIWGSHRLINGFWFPLLQSAIASKISSFQSRLKWRFVFYIHAEMLVSIFHRHLYCSVLSLSQQLISNWIRTRCESNW